MKKFAFVVHLRTLEDIVHTLPLPKFLVLVLKPILLFIFSILRGRSGFSVRGKFRINEETEGYILVIWLTGEQIINERKAHKVRARILETVLYAQNTLGCQIVGLGTLTSSVTDAGRWLVRQPEVKVAVTHGDTYAAAAALQGVQKLANQLNLDLKEARIAIVGATGIIGRALAFQLAPVVWDGLILIGRNQKKLKDLQFRVGGNPRISTDINVIREAEIVVTVTNWPAALLRGEHLKMGAVVYDVSQPRNIAPLLARERPDILIVDGAYVRVPTSIKFWWMSLPPHVTFACMAETIIQALESDFTNHVGEIDHDFLKEILRKAERHGFGLAPFTSFGETITAPRKMVLSGQKDL